MKRIQTSPAGNKRKRQSGFTLIELGVVAFIISLIAAIAVPYIYDVTGLRLRAETRRISGMIRYLYTQSIFTKNSFMLNMDIDKGEFWVEYPKIDHVASTIEVVKYEDNFIKEKRTLPQGVRFKDIITQRAGKLTEDKAVTLFFSNGFIEPTTIHLIDEYSEQEYTLYVRPLTGHVLIMEGYFEVSGEGEIEE